MTHPPPQNDLPAAGLWRVMLGLALPVLLEETLNVLVGFTDRWLAGRFLHGPEPLAAMGLVAYLLWLIPSAFSVIAIGATALVARAVGANQPEEARRVLGQSLALGALFAVAATVAAHFSGAAFIGLLGLEGESQRLASIYLACLTPVIPIIMLEQVGTACLRGAGDTVTGLVARVAVNIVNILVGVALVTGWGPFPDLGFLGLAIGTACGHGVGGIVILAALLRGRRGMQLVAANLRPDVSLQRRLFHVGLPGGADILAVITCHLFYLRIIAGLGTAALAAHSLGLQIEAISYLSGCAFQVAAATMAGQALGANDPARAKRSVLIACGGALAVMTPAALVFYFGGEHIAVWFTGGGLNATSELAGRLLKVVAFGVPSMAVLIVISGALRGAGDTRWNLLITFIGLLGIRLPLAAILAWKEIALPGTNWMLPGLAWGIEGAWIAMVIDVSVRALLSAGRFFHGGWMRVKV